ncbi:MAG: hypothetical protein QOJ65_2560 [Fimbriimonadaceae bacterium]|jgi:hypothetical protein|nr:hypothetical protein [Fimbriimonadaceae bacterium]
MGGAIQAGKTEKISNTALWLGLLSSACLLTGWFGEKLLDSPAGRPVDFIPFVAFAASPVLAVFGAVYAIRSQRFNWRSVVGFLLCVPALLLLLLTMFAVLIP